MKLFSILQLLNPLVTPSNTKVHLATWNGQENPLDVYLAGEFEKWQSWQSKKNFERDYIVSLINKNSSIWLFAGVYSSQSVEWIGTHKCWCYDLKEDPLCSEMNGRLVISFTRSSRQSYLNAENWAEQFIVYEIYKKRLSITEFPSFKAINISKSELDLIIKESPHSWFSALSNVAGVYLISDTETGKLYVGSASGSGGIWQRWVSYAANGHGGNSELKELLRQFGKDRAKSFRYSVLEIADTHSTQEDILNRETHWKNVLLTREYGLNSN